MGEFRLFQFIVSIRVRQTWQKAEKAMNGEGIHMKRRA